MPDKESLYPKDWFTKADKDMQRVEILLREGDMSGAGFHLQQAVEKYLKGYLLSKGWKLKRIHDLEDLLKFAVRYDRDFERYQSLCEVVTEYYAEERYPFVAPSELTKEEIKEGLEKSKELASKILKGFE